jgi:carboxymethylenebutenolidase
VTETTVTASRGDMRTYVATPSTPGPWPGVVVLHDALGYTQDVRNQADWLAAAGFLAAAPDLYYWGKRFQCMRSIFTDLRNRTGHAFDDVEAVRTSLTSRDDCTGKVGVIGYCMGGGFSLLLAPGRGFSASSVNYGTIPKDVDSFLQGSCPIVGSFGAKDRTLKGAAAKLEGALEKNAVAHDVKEYPDAGHSFLNDHDPSERNLLFVVMGRLIGNDHDDASAHDARARIVDFFNAHLKN